MHNSQEIQVGDLVEVTFRTKFAKRQPDSSVVWVARLPTDKNRVQFSIDDVTLLERFKPPEPEKRGSIVEGSHIGGCNVAGRVELNRVRLREEPGRSWYCHECGGFYDWEDIKIL